MMSIRLDEAQRILARAQAKAETDTGPCSQCKWATGTMLHLWRICRNPLVKAYIFSINDAFNARIAAQCDTLRRDGGICGPEGSLFEPGIRRKLIDLAEGAL